jgi:hypothetical protein
LAATLPWSISDSDPRLTNISPSTASETDAAIVVFDRYAIDLSQIAFAGNGDPAYPGERRTVDLLHPE